jgi:phosphatidate cytidylyltransferase
VPRLVPAERVAAASLTLRILSSLVLAPVAVAAVWFGWPWLPIVTILAGAVMAWEWARMCQAGRLGRSGRVLMTVVVAAVGGAAIAGIAIAVALTLLGAALVFRIAQYEERDAAIWLALGAPWIALPCALLLWLGLPEDTGRMTLLWILAVVWATDTGAYAFGRGIGGPRLAPRWSPSPRKTWAGLVGGVLCAGLAGWAAAGLLGVPALPLVLPSAGLAIIGQFGDLAESVAKRRFGVKDSSGLIPGHGGLLDRLDGLLAVVPAVALLTLIGGNVLTWR